MGLLSVVMVRHDGIHTLLKERDFGREVYAKVLDCRPGRSRHIGVGAAMEIVDSNIHASDTRIIVVEGNTAYPIRYGQTKLPEWSQAEATLVNMVKDLGYTVTKKKKGL